MSASISGEKPFIPLTSEELRQKNETIRSCRYEITELKREAPADLDSRISKLSIRSLETQLELHVNAIGLLKGQAKELRESDSPLISAKDEEIGLQKELVLRLETLLNERNAECESIKKELIAAKEACRTKEVAMTTLQKCVPELENRVKSMGIEINKFQQDLQIKDDTLEAINIQYAKSQALLKERDAECESLKVELKVFKETVIIKDRTIELIDTNYKELQAVLKQKIAECVSHEDELKELKKTLHETNKKLAEVKEVEQAKYTILFARFNASQTELVAEKNSKERHLTWLTAADKEITNTKELVTSSLTELLKKTQAITTIRERLEVAAARAAQPAPIPAAALAAAAAGQGAIPAHVLEAMAARAATDAGRGRAVPLAPPAPVQAAAAATAPILAAIAAATAGRGRATPVTQAAFAAAAAGRGAIPASILAAAMAARAATDAAAPPAPIVPAASTASNSVRQPTGRRGRSRKQPPAPAVDVTASTTNSLRRKADALSSPEQESEQRKRLQINPGAAAAPNDDSHDNASVFTSSALDDLCPTPMV